MFKKFNSCNRVIIDFFETSNFTNDETTYVGKMDITMGLKDLAKLSLEEDISSLTLEKTGLKNIRRSAKVIVENTDAAEEAKKIAKIIKLRYTVKQYDTFRDACRIFSIIASHPGFNAFVAKALETEVRAVTIKKQLVDPIVNAPLKIPMKKIRKVGDSPKESYFTAPAPVTPEVKRLYNIVKSKIDKETLKQNIDNDVTCVTDVKKFITTYIAMNNLVHPEHGIELSKGLNGLAPKVIKSNSDLIHRVENKYYIPKGDRKIITLIMNELLFGK